MTTSPMSTASEFERRLPEPILIKLRALLARIRRVMLLRGLLAVAAVALGTLLALMAIDALVVMTHVLPRVLLLLTGVSVVAASWVWFVVRPRRRKISLAALARVIEIQHPELEERISSTVELRGDSGAGGGGPIELPRGSEELIAALAEEATLDAGRIEPRKEVSHRSIKPYLTAAAVLAGVFVLVFLLWPRHAALALTRVVAPMLNRGNLPAIELRVEPGDHVMALGDGLTISAAASEILPDATLEVIDATGYESRLKTEPVRTADGTLATWNFPSVMSGFRYRVRAGRALSEFYEILAVPRPKIEAATVRLDFPPYTAISAETLGELPKQVEVPAGTQIVLRTTTNVPLASPRLMLADGQSLEPTVETDADGRRPLYSWTFAAETAIAGRASHQLEESHGIRGEPLEMDIRVLGDAAPKITLLEPAASQLSLKPTDRLPLRYEAEDDLGLGRIELLVQRDGEPAQRTAQPLPETEKPLRSCQGEAVLDLSQIELGETKQLKVRFEAFDRLPEARQGPQRAESRTIVIDIDRRVDSPMAETAPPNETAQQPPPDAKEPPLSEQERQAQEAAAKRAEELEKLAQQQEQLAEQAGQKPQEQPSAQWRREEQQLAAELAEKIEQSPQAMQAELRADQREAAEMAQTAKELAEDQKWIREQNQANQPQADPEKQKKEVLQKLAEEQKQLAAETAKLQAETPPADAAAKDLAAAQTEMNQAAQAMNEQPAQAAQDAHEAQKQLEAAAMAERQAAASDPTAADRAEKAQALAQRQENLAQAIDAAAGGDMQKALAEMQEGVQQQTEQLQQQSDEMAARTAALGAEQPIAERQQQSQSALHEANQNAQQATDAMQKTPGQAPAAQEKTEQSLAAAADALGQLSQQLGKAADSQPQSPPSPEAQALARAFDEATEAAQARQGAEAERSARDASHQLSQAADAARQNAGQQQAKSQGKPGAKPTAQGKPSPGKPTGPGGQGKQVAKLPPAPPAKVVPTPPKAKGDGDWARLRGQVKREAGDSAAKDADDEYRELIESYFQELSRQGKTP